MNVVARSIGNAFRNWIRTTAVVAVLAVAIGLALAMLVSNQAVESKVGELNASVGTVLTVNPAGGQGFDGGGEPLTSATAKTAAAVPEVTSVVATKQLRLSPASSSSTGQAAVPGGPGGFGGQGTSVSTSLQPAVAAGTLGNRNNSGGQTSQYGGTAQTRTFQLPITATGTGAEVDSSGKALNITSGTGLGDYTAKSTKALLGTTLAQKNNLTVGSTFTIDGTTYVVAGLFDAGTEFGNNAVYLTLPQAQAVAGTPDEVSSLVVTVNSMENVDATRTALQTALGSGKADVTQGTRGLETAVSSLKSVQNISLIAFIASLATAGLVILFIMILLVRERRREIGVLKAIGAPNRTIGLQFVLESLVLVVMGSVVGAMIAAFASNGIAAALVSSNTSSASTGRAGGPGGGFPGGGPGGGGFLGGAGALLSSVNASVSPGVLGLGLAAVFAVAVLGSLVPALLTARIRPIEVLRGE
ncbi:MULTISPECIES: FtsX-like permease family protein [Arthrobacter]|uniref:FtsX-like permease family protein n=2 Tax=Arthrobacter TaxID=1663 RepID=A0ABU9KMY5_9MICC|nr:FtsX-like permease family protein [Arthrobacter sp. YJM1]MDP5228110.1 FtsX-like permease family protein [Arthrobacter sp. YJM1]